MNKQFYSHIKYVLIALIVFVLIVSPRSLSAQTTSKRVSFIDEVAPVLKDHCFICHNAKKMLAKYDMTTFEKLMAGGVSGEPIVAGKPEHSEFYHLMVTNEERRMPPTGMGEAVPQDKAGIIGRWIKEGAKIDEDLDSKANLVKELRLRWKPPVPPKDSPDPVVVNALAVTPDGKELIVGGRHELIVWAIDTGKPVKRIYTRAERSYALVFLPDGKLVVAGGRPGEEGDVRVYDIKAKGKTEGEIEILDGVNDKTVFVKHLFDLEDSVLCLAITPDGKMLAAGGRDCAVRVFDLSSGLDKAKLVQTVGSNPDWVVACSLSADGRFLVSTFRDKCTKVWDLKAKDSVVTFRSELTGSTASNPAELKPKSVQHTKPNNDASTKKTDPNRPVAEASLKASKESFSKLCATCHATDGSGKDLRASMPQLPDFSNKDWQDRNATSNIVVGILDGKGKLMPAFRGRLSEAQARDLAVLIKSFGPEGASQPLISKDEFDKQFLELEEQLKDLQKQFKESEKLPPKRKQE